MTITLKLIEDRTDAGFVIKQNDEDLSATRSYLHHYSPQTNGPIVEKSDEYILHIDSSNLYPSLFSFQPQNNKSPL